MLDDDTRVRLIAQHLRDALGWPSAQAFNAGLFWGIALQHTRELTSENTKKRACALCHAVHVILWRSYGNGVFKPPAYAEWADGAYVRRDG